MFMDTWRRIEEQAAETGETDGEGDWKRSCCVNVCGRITSSTMVRCFYGLTALTHSRSEE